MKLEDLKTWADLEEYLLRRDEYATNEPSKMNRTFTKKEVWDMYLVQCIKYKPSDLPIRTRKILLKHVRKDFWMSMDEENKEFQIGCGYCAHEKNCKIRDPKINKAKLGCYEWKHWNDDKQNEL